MKYSKQRELIYEAIEKNAVHPTADEVYTMLKGDHPGLSLGTVYRNLNLLSEIGRLRRISVPHGAERFDANTDEHLHVVCSVCGRLEDVYVDDPQNFVQIIKEKTNIPEISGYSLLLFGACSRCRREIS